MKKAWLLLLFALITMSAAFVFAEGTLPKPDVLGEENILTSKRLSAYDTVIIRDFDISKAVLENINDEEKQKEIEPIRESLPKTMSASFVSELKDRKLFKNVLTNAKKTGNAIIIEGKVTKLSGGHGAAKFFLGWMAPQNLKTHIEVSGRIVDAKTGDELATFSDSKAGVTGSTMGWLKEVMVNLAGDEGRELAEFVAKLH